MVTGSRCFHFILECVERQKDVTNEKRKPSGGIEQGGSISALSLKHVPQALSLFISKFGVALHT